MNYLIVLALTILIEFFVFAIFIRKDYEKLFLYSVLINSFTNPLANLFSSYVNVALVEFFVVIIEIFLIKYLLEVKYWKAILISLVANLVSFIIGYFLLISFGF